MGSEQYKVIGQTKGGELEKETTHIIVEIIEYIPNAVVSRTIIKKNSGNITAMSLDQGEELGEKTVPFDCVWPNWDWQNRLCSFFGKKHSCRNNQYGCRAILYPTFCWYGKA